MEWKESFSEGGKCWWLATDRAPCVAQVRKTNGTYVVEFFDALGEGYSQSTGFRNLVQAKHVAARRFRDALNRSEAWPMTLPVDAMIEPDFIYIP
ncbi:hypothetical protein [Aliiruegeria lutimaris]|uniref:Uncharacterized protein n=1 Tax=Aliiruegeria lutimaris TaxID=571298 RepID=A0A1G9LB63_9RHOB|nr:hypothetical protein [Aliiruegeria lutimaris]SDL59208.1 hypothetical protein SAMN04488026_10969 [Aliiruegeria lutimaris]